MNGFAFGTFGCFMLNTEENAEDPQSHPLISFSLVSRIQLSRFPAGRLGYDQYTRHSSAPFLQEFQLFLPKFSRAQPTDGVVPLGTIIL